MDQDKFHEDNFDAATCDAEALAAAIICATNPLRFAYLCGVQSARHKHGMSQAMTEAYEDGEDYFKIVRTAATNNGKRQLIVI